MLRGGADGELLRLSDKQSYVVSPATLPGTRPRMDAPIPLRRTGVHAMATDHGGADVSFHPHDIREILDTHNRETKEQAVTQVPN